SDIFFMEQAIHFAKEAQKLNEVPIGAVAVFENKIIGAGWNCPISTNDPTNHAEIVALRNAAKKLNNYRLVDVTLYVTLEPCAMCIGAMLYARVKRLVFGADDPKAGAVVSVFQLLDEKKLNHKIIYTGGVLKNECGKLLSDFFLAKRKK
ncbi:MAG: tRNA adenosine(34) deaminase TadA, partial [Gammaproteobacteria bacterium]|nr:tRNA adenosine(34) deaminase TadA [Gammaproteobacteria bacterium]